MAPTKYCTYGWQNAFAKALNLHTGYDQGLIRLLLQNPAFPRWGKRDSSRLSM